VRNVPGESPKKTYKKPKRASDVSLQHTVHAPMNVRGLQTGPRMREPRAEATMIRHLLAFALSLTVLPAVASAEQAHMGTPEQQRACRPDAQRLCRGMQNQGDYAIADCLRTNMQRLSAACRRVIEGGGR
jgi:hypothetical protein